MAAAAPSSSSSSSASSGARASPASSAPVLTTSYGTPVDDTKTSLTVGPYGPTLVMDHQLLDKLAHFDRERIPERVVHAKGAGAHGYFEATHDMSAFTSAKYLKKGTRTPVFVRFSTVAGERGSQDTVRDPRGFAIKHFTEEGVFDLVMNNLPIFFLGPKSARSFPDFIHTQKRSPDSGVVGVTDAHWDYCTQATDSVHMLMMLFSSRGTPVGYRRMNGYSGHTLAFSTSDGKRTWVKYHYKPAAGIKNFTADEAAAMASKDPDFATRDLYNTIAEGGKVAWDVFVQLISEADAEKLPFNLFDLTKIVPHSMAPLVPIGRMVLDRNPKNYFAETEQVAFSPGNLVPGIELSPDPVLQTRVFSYADSQRHRLGANYNQLPINCPYLAMRGGRAGNYQRDGAHVTNGNGGGGPNYSPNTEEGTPQPSKRGAITPFHVSGWVGRGHAAAAPSKGEQDNDFTQARLFWLNVLPEAERTALVQNIAGHMSGISARRRKDLVPRVIDLFTKVHPDLGRRLEAEVRKSASKL